MHFSWRCYKKSLCIIKNQTKLNFMSSLFFLCFGTLWPKTYYAFILNQNQSSAKGLEFYRVNKNKVKPSLKSFALGAPVWWNSLFFEEDILSPVSIGSFYVPQLQFVCAWMWFSTVFFFFNNIYFYFKVNLCEPFACKDTGVP